MLDVDDFKAINDAFGHQAGDLVLQEVCAAIRSCVRSDDVVARLGGEEFAVLTVLPPADLAELGERIRRRVAERCGNLAVTASLGVTWADPAASHPHRDLHGLWQLINRADALMYLAKSQGRDRVCLDRGSG
jgi:diguanylate cyclase (GGDEF)-like protein